MKRFTLTILAVFAMLCSQVMADDRVVAYEIVNGRSIPKSLTANPGDPEIGRRLYFDREITGCSGCHGSPGGPGAQPNADASNAPQLAGVADRMDEGVLRLWLVAPQVMDPETSMPAYYAVGQRSDENDPLYGSTRLSAAEIEALVAYLMRQKTETRP
ncbi:MAG: c-type cytochrome [Pseudomonadota bacterium]